MKTLYGAALLAALLGGALLGYRVGTWSLDKAQAQLAALDRAAEQARLEHEAARKRLEQELTSLRTEHGRRSTEQEQTFKTEKLALQNSLAAAAERLSAVETRRQRTADELRHVRDARDSAAGALRDELQKQEQELQRLHDALENERAGLACLTIEVPADLVRRLNASHAPKERAHR